MARRMRRIGVPERGARTACDIASHSSAVQGCSGNLPGGLAVALNTSFGFIQAKPLGEWARADSAAASPAPHSVHAARGAGGAV